MNTVEQTINDIVSKLETVADEESIKTIVTDGWRSLKAEVSQENTFNRKVRTPLRKAIEKAFPSKNIEESKPEGYYKTNAGKDKASRWEHLALWYATTNEDRWNVVGDEARAEYWGSLPVLPEKTVNEEHLTEQPVEQIQVQANQAPETEQIGFTTLTLQDMTLEHLELDAETQQIVSNALEHSGMSLADFIKQACKVYAKTLAGKAKQSEDDLSAVPTEKLLNASHVVNGREFRNRYYTHPNRAEELTKRAITAIQRHNINAPEQDQRWKITQTAIQALTGSKPATIKKILEQYQTMIDDHNAKYGFDGEDSKYVNRKGNGRKIKDEIQMAELVPDGLDL